MTFFAHESPNPVHRYETSHPDGVRDGISNLNSHDSDVFYSQTLHDLTTSLKINK